MAEIRKIKTWNGVKYAVVEPFTVVKEKPVYKVVEGKDGKSFKKKIRVETFKETVYHAVEYGKDNEHVAIFELNVDGLDKAREVQKLFKKVS